MAEGVDLGAEERGSGVDVGGVVGHGHWVVWWRTVCGVVSIVDVNSVKDDGRQD